MNATLGFGKPELMQAYYLAQRDMVATGQWERGRTDKALGLLQSNSTRRLEDGRLDITSGDGQDFYIVGEKGCQCADHERKHTPWCKHRIAWALCVKARQLVKATKPQLILF